VRALTRPSAPRCLLRYYVLLPFYLPYAAHLPCFLGDLAYFDDAGVADDDTGAGEMTRGAAAGGSIINGFSSLQRNFLWAWWRSAALSSR
jgi:hypothetical protein